jgi:arginase family enzyme
MKNIGKYLKSVDKEALGLSKILHPQQLANSVTFYTPASTINLDEIEIGIIGIPESRNHHQNASCHLAPDEIRRQLYQLYRWKKAVKIVDFGNFIIGETIEDSYIAISELTAYLLQHNVIPVILGGSNDLAYALYRTYVTLEQVVNMVAVDSRFDLGNEESPIKANAYLDKIVMQRPNFLLNYANIGYQSYLVAPENSELMQQLFFETYRVGTMRKNMEEIEPVVRNADLLTIDMAVVRRADAPGSPHSTINGFYGEEICQVAQFAGMSDKLTMFGIFEFDPTQDYNNQTSQLASHILWYFVEGYLHRAGDTLFKNKTAYTQHSITVSDTTQDLIFYCSKQTNRWWMVVPVINLSKNMERFYFLPCTLKEFEMACENKIPERWWRTYHKLNR